MAQRGRRSADQKLILALTCGATIEAAARQAGVSEATVYRRLKDPEFKAQLQTARQGMVERTTNMLSAASTESVKTLLRLQGERYPPAVQLGAAKAIVELGSKLRDNQDLFERVVAIQTQLANSN
jgi:transposase-like protein